MITIALGSFAAGCRSRGARSVADFGAEASIDAMSGVGFDGARASRDLIRLEQLGDRRSGSRGAGRARSLIRREARRAGFEAEDVEATIELVGAGGAPQKSSDTETMNAPTEQRVTHVVATREGASSDVILLVAPYDTRVDTGSEAHVAGGGPEGSGASVLLELARVDRAVRDEIGTPPFTLVLAFVDGDGLGEADPGADPARAHPGTDAFARWWLEEHPERYVRLAVWIDGVGASQTEVARDLHSSRVYREVFFAAGEERGLQPAFIAARPLSAPAGGHRALQARGFSPVVALVGDVSNEGMSHANDAAEAAGGAPSAASLAAVGEATWWGLVEISDRLARIDSFRVDPLGGGPGSLELPGSDEGGRMSTGGSSDSDAETEPAAHGAETPAAPR